MSEAIDPQREQPNLEAELSRLQSIGDVAAGRFRSLYLRRTLRSIATELQYLRLAKQGPTFILDRVRNGVGKAYYYQFNQVLAWFGGREALFHRDDYPELWPHKGARPSARYRKRKNTI